MRLPLLSLILLWSLLLSPHAGAAPNIIVITADDLAYGDLGSFFQNSRAPGKMRLSTPNLDRMAAEGMMLTHHYSGAPICVSARATLFTGRNQGHCAVRDAYFDMAWPSAQPSLGTVLKQAGYHAALYGKYGLCGTNINSPYNTTGHPLYRGFDDFVGYLRHADQPDHFPGNSGKIVQNFGPLTNGNQNVFNDDLFVGRAKQYVITRTQTAPSQPFFLMLNLTCPHYDLQFPPGPYPAGSGLNGGMTLPPPAGTPDSFIHPDILAATYDHDNNPATAQVAWPNNARRHAALIRRLDESVGDLLQLLRDLGIDDDTLVVLTSDNGPDNNGGANGVAHDPRNFDSWGPFDGIKGCLLEGGIRMPTLVWGPGRIPAGVVNPTVSTGADWLPTLADFAGLPPPGRCDGVSLRRTLTGQAGQRALPFQYFEYSRTPGLLPVDYQVMARKGLPTLVGFSQAIRIGDFMGYRMGPTSQQSPLRLYNVVADPHQDTDLAANPAHAGLVSEMSRLMISGRQPHDGFPRVIDTARLPSRGVAGQPGLTARRFEGSWPWLPDLAALTPVSTALVSTVDLSARTRDDNIGLEFTGFIHTARGGLHRFFLTADTGAALWIDESNLIADDLTSFGTREGTVQLQPGLHAFRLAWHHRTGARQLGLEWENPGFNRRPVSPSDFCRQALPPDAPVAYDDFFDVSASTPTLLNVLENDMRVSGPLLVELPPGSPPAFSVSDDQVLCTPAMNFLGDLTTRYVVHNGSHSATGTVRVSVNYNTADLWLPFESLSGAFTREAGGRLAGELKNFPAMPAPVVPGRFGTALAYDGVDDKVVVTGYAPPVGTASRTVAAWVKTTANGPVVTYGPSLTGQKWFLEIDSPAGQPSAGVIRVGIGNGYVMGTRNLRDGQWHHLACTFGSDGTPTAADVNLYVDGEPELRGMVQEVPINTGLTDVWIGGDIHGRFFTGVIDNARIIRRVLAPEEIAAMAGYGASAATAAWSLRYFGQSTFSWDADADGDGQNNFLEFATGTQPWSPDRGAQNPVGRVVGGQFRLEARRRAGFGLVYTVETSTDLVNWAPAGAVPLPVRADDEPGFEVAPFLVPSNADRLYTRLRVSLP